MNITVKKFHELTPDELYDILRLRCQVFAVEQDCVYQDMDGYDKDAYHIFLCENDEMTAYARLLPAGVIHKLPVIGRVLSAKRRCGYGSAVIAEAIKTAEEKLGADVIKISAQLHAVNLYKSFGFEIVSDEYLEVGIPHVEMHRKKQ